MAKPEALGDQVLRACAKARGALVLCAPFVKVAVLNRVLDATEASVAVELFTRWRAEEVAAGVSDTGVLEVSENRGGQVLLCDRLHAKYVRFDDRALIGSANLTATALGWRPMPNLELLVELPADTPALVDLERQLRDESIPATAALAAEIDRIAATLPHGHLPPQEALEQVGTEGTGWYPTLREPHDLFVAYSAGLERLAQTSASAAALDLSFLEVPPGFSRPAFEAVVGSRLLQIPLVQNIDAFLTEPQRFGAVRDLIGKRLQLEREEADFAWQTIMRWLMEFLPQRYERHVGRRSEVFSRRGGTMEPAP